MLELRSESDGMFFLDSNICELPSVLKILKFILSLLNIIRFLVPVILIVMLMIDIGKNVIARSEDEMKKSFNLAIKRLIMAVVIFLIPNIVIGVLDVASSLTGDALKTYEICKNNLGRIAELDEEYKEAKRIEEEERKAQREQEKNSESGTNSRLREATGSEDNSNTGNSGNSSTGDNDTASDDSGSNSNKDDNSGKSYSTLHKLGELKRVEFLTVSSSYSYRFAQAFCKADGYYIASAVSEKSSANIFIYDSSKKLVKKYTVPFGHANGCTYNSNNKTVYFTDIGGKTIFYSFPISNIANKINYSSTSFMNGNNKVYSGAIAYDKSNGLYYFLNGNLLYVYNSQSKKIIKTIKLIYKKTNQDIGGHNGLIYYLRWNEDDAVTDNTPGGARNAIDIYRVKDGAYLGTYVIPNSDGDEIESIDYSGVGNEFLVYFNTPGTGNNKVYKVNIPLSS